MTLFANIKRLLLLCGVFLCVGCQQYYGVIAYQEHLDPDYWASTHVGSPDPRRQDPLEGTLVIVEWWVPKALLQYEPMVRISMLFNNFTQRCVEYPICQRIGYRQFPITGDYFEKTGGILTYKAEIITNDGEVYKSWHHQLYVELITVDEE